MSTLRHDGAPSAALQEIFALGRVYDREGRSVALGSNVSAAETALLHAAVREVGPAASVEIGFAQGVSTLAILDAVRRNGRGRHHVIDPFQRDYGYAGCEMVRRAGLAEHYAFHEAFAEEVVPGLPALQFAFFDSSHLFDLTVCEFVLVDKRLEVGGVIGLHDMWMPAQQAFVRYLLANRAYEVWRPPGSAAEPAAPEPLLKRAFRACARRVPAAERVFSQELLRPWRDFGLGNLVLVRKLAPDTRDWRHHVRF